MRSMRVRSRTSAFTLTLPAMVLQVLQQLLLPLLLLLVGN